jgi:hypothetical protein
MPKPDVHAQRLILAGKCLFGERWMVPTAAALRVTPQYIALLAKGERPLTAEKQAALAVFLRAEAQRLQVSAKAAIVLAEYIEQGLK